MGSSFNPDSLNDLLPVYYKRLFPYEPYCRWLGAGNTDKTFLARREFSFTLQDDIYIRYQVRLLGLYQSLHALGPFDMVQVFFHFPLLPAFLLSDLFLAPHFHTVWLSRLGIGNQVGSITDHL